MIPGLKLLQVAADFVNVDIMPANVQVAVNRERDVVVEVVKALEQLQLVLCLLQLWILGHCQSKQLFTASLPVVPDH